MNIKKTTSIFLVSSALLGFGISAPSLMHINAQTTQTSQNNDQGVITVNYVDQNGKTIRQATTATGKSGSTYVASVPNISGYTYSKIENGQNDSYGPQMVFGGSDPATHNESMTIVYKSSGNSSTNSGSNSTNGNKGTATTPAKSGNSKNSSSNSNSNNTNKNSAINTANGTSKKSSSTNGTNNNGNSKSSTNNGTSKSSNNKNGTTTSSDNKNSSANNGDNSTNNANDEKNNNSDDNVNKNTKKNNKNKDQNKADNDNKKDDSAKNKDKKKTHKSVIPWVISGIILVVIAGAVFAWHALRKPRHFKH